MKPRVFLSHSKKDKLFIEEVAASLRAARIDVWYDEWEIPVGESFRSSINDGISQSDLFFVYLTPHSVESSWVQLELDAAFVKKINTQKETLALFVDSNETRTQLPLDMQTLHSPILNKEDYIKPLSQLIAKAYESKARTELLEVHKNHRLEVLEIQDELKSLRLEIAQEKDSNSLSKVLAKMQSVKFLLNERDYSLDVIFDKLKYSLATSATQGYLESITRAAFSIEPKTKEGTIENFRVDTGFSFHNILGRLIILGLVEHLPGDTENFESYRLTDFGKRVANQPESK